MADLTSLPIYSELAGVGELIEDLMAIATLDVVTLLVPNTLIVPLPTAEAFNANVQYFP